MFDHFDRRSIDACEARINFRIGGEGPPLLLLHGFPLTHTHWHAIAPLLMNRFTLVLPDLRGYGDSLGPRPDADHNNYSKRTMARDMIAVMAELGFNRFRLAGHDRGARVAYRLTLDHPQHVTHLASIDTVPTLDVWESMDSAASIDSFHWPFLAQPAPVPEKMIGADPDFFLHHLLGRWAGNAKPLAQSAVEEYRYHFRKPSVIEAMTEDYRAGATVDLLHDRQDRADQNRIHCPVLVPWGNQYTLASPLGRWNKWADDVREISIDCGHFVAEEAPEQCARALMDFFE